MLPCCRGTCRWSAVDGEVVLVHAAPGKPPTAPNHEAQHDRSGQGNQRNPASAADASLPLRAAGLLALPMLASQLPPAVTLRGHGLSCFWARHGADP